MAYIVNEDLKTSAGPAPASLVEHGHGTDTAQNIVISPAGMTEVPVPGQGFISNAVMTQEGSDLILESPDGVTIVIEGYFSGDTPPNLVAPDGKVLTPALVKSFIQASTDFAEEKTAMNDSSPVGQVDEVSGHATVTHPNGTHEVIAKGTAIYEGDVIETDAKGAVNVHFADDSSFAVSNNAKMAIDEFVFDSSTNNGDNKFSMLRGMFVYTSGLVGREDPDDVHINTPVGSIGIRGTIITGVIPGDGASFPAQISVVEGAIVIHPLNGEDITLAKQFETVQIDTGNGVTTNIGVLPQAEMAETFNVLRTVAPTLFSAMDEAQHETAPQDGTQAPADATAPSDTPAPDAAPTDAPQETAPVPNDGLIQLNLLPDHLNTDMLTGSTLTMTESVGTETVTTLGMATTLAPSPVMSISQPVIATTPDAAQTADAGVSTQAANANGGGGNIAPPPANHLPVAALSNYTAFEQAGIANGGTHSFNIGHFFSDADGDPLTYSYAVSNDPNNALQSVDVGSVPGLLNFVINPSLGVSGAPISVDVVASDGQGNSSAVTFTFYAYTSTGPYNGTNGDDTFYMTFNSVSYTMQDGNDQVEFSSGTDNSRVWGGNGEDTAAIYSSNNKFFGEGGNDTINVYTGTGNLVSGGAGNDIINLQTTALTVFGGEDDDIITFNSTAYGGLTSGTTLVDGGTGFDTLSFGGGTINLSALSPTSLIGIEKIQATFTGPAVVQLDIGNILTFSSDKRLFIDTDANDTVVVSNVAGNAAMTDTGSTVVQDSETYHVYSNGTATLYINQATTNVTFT